MFVVDTEVSNECRRMRALKSPGAGPVFKSRFSGDSSSFENLISYKHVMIILIITT